MPLGRAALIVLALGLCEQSFVARTAEGAQEFADSRVLVPGIALERTISAGQAHRYSLSLAAGDFLQITIAQQGIDLVAVLTGPDGRERLSVDTCDDDFRRERVVVIADTSGRHQLVVRPGPATAPSGRYTIQVEQLRPATPIDLERVEAERAFERGRALTIQGQPGKYAAGIDELTSALDRYQRLNDRGAELYVLIQLSLTQARLGRVEALATAREAERLAREAEDAAATAAALISAGAAYDRAGDPPGALRAYREAQAISRKIGNRKAEAVSLNGQGISHGRSGEGEQAVACFEEALPLARAAGNQPLQWSIPSNLGITYKNLGEFERALEAYRQALAVASATGNKEGQAVVLINMGNLQRLLGHDREAMALHEQSLALAREVGGKEHEARSLNTIGHTYYALGDYARAFEHHRQSLEIRREIGDLVGQAASRHGEGRALHKLGDSARALTVLSDALARWRSIREQLGEMDTLHALAAVERDRGQLDAAVEYVRAAVDVEESVRQRITSPALRASFTASGQEKYSLFVDILQAQHAIDASGGHDAAALHVSERARARVLLESALDARIDLREGIEPGLLERERALQKQLDEASTRLSRALGRKAAGEQAEAAAQAMDQLSRDYQRLQAEIRQQSPKYAAVTQPQPLTAAEIQRTVLDEDTVLLEFALGEERSWLWAVTPTTLTSSELPPRAVIDAAARSLHQRLTARQPEPGESAARRAARIARAEAALADDMSAISRMLFEGVARALHTEWSGKRLAIVATGALEYLPFAALPLPLPDAPSGAARGPAAGSRARRARPLIAAHEIVTLPSASVLAVLRRETAGRKPASRALAVLADPVFEHGDPRVGIEQGRRPGVPRVSTAAAVASVARDGLGRLPFSREEADTIAALVPARDVFKAVDFRASRTTVLVGSLEGYRMVHFATHGVLDSARPSLSSLVLSLVDERGAPQNGYLRLHDIYNLRLDADLVVLSACQTALGKEIRGEGLVGLTRAFMYAGAPRVVASLWEVNDVATAELMKAFYAGMLRRRLAPAAALRAAQLELSRNPRWASPYYWAGFTLQGDWK
jgi:CHAT domain-containing protein